MDRRVVITGIGVLAPGGTGTKEFWDLLSEGRTATRRHLVLRSAPVPLPGRGRGRFRPGGPRPEPAAGTPHGPGGQFAVVAAGEAPGRQRHRQRVAGPAPGRRRPSAVRSARRWGWTASTAVVSDGGRLDLVDHDYAVRHLYDYFVPSSFAREVAWTVGAEGPATVVSTGCTSGLDSVGYATELIREGSADVMIAGVLGRTDLAHHRRLLRRDQGDDISQRRSRARLPAVRPEPRWLRAR